MRSPIVRTSTVGAVTSDILTFSMGATSRSGVIQVQVAGFESTTPTGVGYELFAAIRGTGAAAALIGTQNKTAKEGGGLATADADIISSGNNIIIRVTGVAGFTISWVASFEILLV